jgi:hypothetical protein
MGEEYLDEAKAGASLVAVGASEAPGRQGTEDPGRTVSARMRSTRPGPSSSCRNVVLAAECRPECYTEASLPVSPPATPGRLRVQGQE